MLPVVLSMPRSSEAGSTLSAVTESAKSFAPSTSTIFASVTEASWREAVSTAPSANSLAVMESGASSAAVTLSASSFAPGMTPSSITVTPFWTRSLELVFLVSDAERSATASRSSALRSVPDRGGRSVIRRSAMTPSRPRRPNSYTQFRFSLAAPLRGSLCLGCVPGRCDRRSLAAGNC